MLLALHILITYLVLLIDYLIAALLVWLQKERDLELAARIGQSLLKKNKTLSDRNEVLEEQVEHAREEVQLTFVRLAHLARRLS